MKSTTPLGAMLEDILLKECIKCARYIGNQHHKGQTQRLVCEVLNAAIIFLVIVENKGAQNLLMKLEGN